MIPDHPDPAPARLVPEPLDIFLILAGLDFEPVTLDFEPVTLDALDVVALEVVPNIASLSPADWEAVRRSLPLIDAQVAELRRRLQRGRDEAGGGSPKRGKRKV
jgi:hypothetical protein